MKAQRISLTEAKAKLSSLVRIVQEQKRSIILTVDGHASAEIRAVRQEPEALLSDDEVLLTESLLSALQGIESMSNAQSSDKTKKNAASKDSWDVVTFLRSERGS